MNTIELQPTRQDHGKKSACVSHGVYDAHDSQNYQLCKRQPFRTRIELFTWFHILGRNLHGQTVLDVACGDGWLTRAIKRTTGAKFVLGTDLSPQMIGLAKQKEVEIEEREGNEGDEQKHQRLEYRVQDARSPEVCPWIPEGGFDVVTAGWLLVNARDREQLARFCRHMAAQLRCGGKVITCVTNPELYLMRDDPPQYEKYGIKMELPEHPVKHGDPMLIHLVSQDGASVSIENYYFPIEVYQAELRSAGFTDIEIHPLQLQPHPNGEDEGDYWEEIVQRKPYAVFIEAMKGSTSLKKFVPK